MRRGWEVELNNGTIMDEDNYAWKDVPNKDIKCLSLLFDGRRWDISGKEAYFIKNSASMAPGIQESFRIERRCIGYYEGATKINYLVDEYTGKFTIKIDDSEV